MAHAYPQQMAEKFKGLPVITDAMNCKKNSITKV